LLFLLFFLFLSFLLFLLLFLLLLLLLLLLFSAAAVVFVVVLGVRVVAAAAVVASVVVLVVVCAFVGCLFSRCRGIGGVGTVSRECFVAVCVEMVWFRCLCGPWNGHWVACFCVFCLYMARLKVCVFIMLCAWWSVLRGCGGFLF